jgi:hypothetical protein
MEWNIEVETLYAFEFAASPKNNSYKNAIHNQACRIRRLQSTISLSLSPCSPQIDRSAQNPSITPTMSFSPVFIGSLAAKKPQLHTEMAPNHGIWPKNMLKSLIPTRPALKVLESWGGQLGGVWVSFGTLVIFLSGDGMSWSMNDWQVVNVINCFTAYFFWVIGKGWVVVSQGKMSNNSLIGRGRKEKENSIALSASRQANYLTSQTTRT